MQHRNDLRIAAVVGVKDQSDLISACVMNLLRIGIDLIAIVDDDSVDGTKEIIDQLVRENPSQIIVPNPGDSLGSHLSYDGPVLGELIRRLQPDWLLACDADEFHIPKGGDLKQLDELQCLDVIAVPRYNIAFPGPESVRALRLEYESLLDVALVVGTDPFTSDKLAEHDVGDRWIMRRILPKLMVRPQVVSRYKPGMHDVDPIAGAALKRGTARDLLAVHVPFTSYEQFRRKVDNVREVFRRFDADYNLGGWHWRRWVRLAEEGGLEAEFARQIIAPEELRELERKGTVSSARKIFQDTA